MTARSDDPRNACELACADAITNTAIVGRASALEHAIRVVVRDELSKDQNDRNARTPHPAGDVPEWFENALRTVWFCDEASARRCWGKVAPEIARQVEAMTEKYRIETNNAVMELDRVDEAKDQRIAELEQAIRTHREQKADDRCIEDDDRLYEALGDGIKCDRRVGSKNAMLKNCERFINRRCEEGGPWPSYVELESQLAVAKAEVEQLKTENATHVAAVDDINRINGETLAGMQQDINRLRAEVEHLSRPVDGVHVRRASDVTGDVVFAVDFQRERNAREQAERERDELRAAIHWYYHYITDATIDKILVAYRTANAGKDGGE